MKNNILVLGASILMSTISMAQTTLTEEERQKLVQQVKREVLDSIQKQPKKPIGQISDELTISGYLEMYYIYDFGNPSNHTRPSFVYSHNRHQEINLNLGYIKATYQNSKVRANLALAAGTYMNANYGAEPNVLKNIYEANIGVKISKKHDLWLDAGIMSSHLGFESAVGKDNWTLTRSLFADNSPYFETGAKVNYTTSNSKWMISGLILNGWQRIQRTDGNNTPAFGHQLVYKPSAKVMLSSGSFIGNDKPDSTRQMRYFHNLYGIFQLSERIGLTTGFDVGVEQTSKGSSSYNSWFTPVVIFKVNASEKWSLSFRGEYFSDPKGVIIATGTTNNFQTIGYSMNLDYAIHNNVMWRLEGRGFSSKDKIFNMNNSPSQHNFFVATSLAVSF